MNSIQRSGLSPWHPAALIATWFGAGLLPWAPGTWGSLAALPFAWIIGSNFGTSALIIAAAIAFLVGWWAAERVEHATGIEDSNSIVIDEVAGQWLTLAAAPPSPLGFAIGFLLFRLFDITKPWPARWADRTLPGGFGVMADDAIAALYSVAMLVVWRAILGSLSGG